MKYKLTKKQTWLLIAALTVPVVPMMSASTLAMTTAFLAYMAWKELKN